MPERSEALRRNIKKQVLDQLELFSTVERLVARYDDVEVINEWCAAFRGARSWLHEVFSPSGLAALDEFDAFLDAATSRPGWTRGGMTSHGPGKEIPLRAMSTLVALHEAGDDT